MTESQEREMTKIARFLTLFAPFIRDMVSQGLARNGFKFTTSGNGLDLVYKIAHQDRNAILFFRNMYLGIAAIDSDAESLQFDEKLSDLGYFVSKTICVVKSKLDVLTRLLKSEDPDQAIDEILRDFCGERILIQRLDMTKSGDGSQ